MISGANRSNNQPPKIVSVVIQAIHEDGNLTTASMHHAGGLGIVVNKLDEDDAAETSEET